MLDTIPTCSRRALPWPRSRLPMWNRRRPCSPHKLLPHRHRKLLPQDARDDVVIRPAQTHDHRIGGPDSGLRERGRQRQRKQRRHNKDLVRASRCSAPYTGSGIVKKRAGFVTPSLSLLEAGVRDATHADCLFMFGSSLKNSIKSSKLAMPSCSRQDEGGHQIFFDRQRQLGTHVHIGAGRHGIIPRQDRIGEGVDGRPRRPCRIVALENAVNESAVDRAPVFARNSGAFSCLPRSGCLRRSHNASSASLHTSDGAA